MLHTNLPSENKLSYQTTAQLLDFQCPASNTALIQVSISEKSVVVINTFEQTDDGLLTSLRVPTIPELLNKTAPLNAFVFKVRKLSVSATTVALPVSSVIAKCDHVPIKHSKHV